MLRKNTGVNASLHYQQMFKSMSSIYTLPQKLYIPATTSTTVTITNSNNNNTTTTTTTPNTYPSHCFLQVRHHSIGELGIPHKKVRKKNQRFNPTALGYDGRNPELIQPILFPDSSNNNNVNTNKGRNRYRNGGGNGNGENSMNNIPRNLLDDLDLGRYKGGKNQVDFKTRFGMTPETTAYRVRDAESALPKSNKLSPAGTAKTAGKRRVQAERAERAERKANGGNNKNILKTYTPVDLLASPKAKKFYEVCQAALQEMAKTRSTIPDLMATSPGTEERKECIDKVIKQMLHAIKACSLHNSGGVWDLVKMDDSEFTHDLEAIFDEYTADVNATDAFYQEYENDLSVFEGYINNPPLVPTLGRVLAIFENVDFTDSALARFPSRHNKSNASPTDVETVNDVTHGLITTTQRLFASSFLRYFRAKVRVQFSLNSKASLHSNLDMTRPGEWYPGARALRRNVYLHIGPTNSGKTYQALQALRKAKSGYYAGPLRLLAREIFNRFRAEGKLCNLITGEEVLEYYDEFGLPCKVSSGTIEMVDTNRPMDVAVIDEIQMIEDETRGWAWTHAFLGVQAKEVHLCGDPSSEKIIRKLVAETGDNLIIKKYERLSKLVVDKAPVKALKPGDCIVAFSRRELLDQKALVENTMKSNCSIIYGALPPESRSRQAELFNEGENDYKYLVASDAVGMGLNLSIKRIIFLTTMKFNGRSRQRVSVSQIKQIAGRAGRYRIAPTKSSAATETPAILQQDELIKEDQDKEEKEKDSTGYVTAFDNRDLKYITQCLKSKTPVIYRGGLFPSESSFRQYALPLFSSEPFDKILERIEVASNVSSANFLSGVHNMVEISQLFRGIAGLTLNEQLVLSKAPVKTGNDKCIMAFQRFCVLIARSESASLLELPEVGIDNLSMSRPFSKEDISVFESTHSIIVLYLWLSYRFPLNFMDRKGAFACKELCERLIDQGLVDTRSKRLESWKRKTQKSREREEKEMELRPLEEKMKQGESEEVIVDVNSDVIDIPSQAQQSA